MNKQYKILTISDIILVPSGVSTQMKYLTEGLLKTDRYIFRMIGGAIKHPSYNPIVLEPWKEKCIIFPKDGMGSDPLFLRSLLDAEKPDALFIFTDPRFFVWLWEMSDEILPKMPIIYWHVWDNNPVPRFNNNFYKSTTFTGCISKLTYNIMTSLGYDKRSKYIPHAIDHNVFKPLAENEVQKQKDTILGEKHKNRRIIFWNNRNARRKNPIDVIRAVCELNKRLSEKEQVTLLMHTNPLDDEGPNLFEVIQEFKAQDFVMFSSEKLPPDKMNTLYNITDVTLNIAFAEGFGLSNLESMTAGTCVIANRTGGLQDQIDESVSEKDKWGYLIGPDNTTTVGSQQIHFIDENRVNVSTVTETLYKFFSETSREERKRRGLLAREYSMKNFAIEKMISDWDEAITSVIENYKTTYKHFDNWRLHTL